MNHVTCNSITGYELQNVGLRSSHTITCADDLNVTGENDIMKTVVIKSNWITRDILIRSSTCLMDIIHIIIKLVKFNQESTRIISEIRKESK